MGKKKHLHIRVSGEAADMLRGIHDISKGKRSYTAIMNELLRKVERPEDKIIQAYDNLEKICDTYFNPDLANMVALLRTVVVNCAKGRYDPKEFRDKILEFLESQGKEK